MKKEITPSSSTLSSSSTSSSSSSWRNIGLFFFFTFFYIMTPTVLAFTIPTPSTNPTTNPTTNTYHHNQQRHCSSTVLYGRKKGKLLTQSILVQQNKNEKEKSNTSTFQKEDKEGVKVSSSLSQWIASQNNNGQDTEEDEDNIIMKNTNSKSPSTTENKKIQSILSSIHEIISSNNFNIPSLLSLLSTLISHQQEDNKVNESFNTLLLQTKNGNQNVVYNYKLVWVGSDDGICHLGTGLHKVPLARLQDVFMTIGGMPISTSTTDINSYIMDMKGSKKKKGKKGKKNKNILNNGITVMEVIRILGPFPNVRNTLQGRIINGSSTSKNMSSSSSSSSGSSSNAFGNSIMDNNNNNSNGNDIVGTNNNVKGHQVTIVYDSMMDGLGKEIKAGKDGDVRSVDLNILYADENVIVCVMPSTTNDNNDVDVDDDTSMFGANGENVLLFMKEDDLDAKLEGLRAA